MDAANSRCLSVEETAERIGVCRTYMYEILGTGAIRSIKVGRRRLVPEIEIARFITRQLGEEEKEGGHDRAA